ncbi:MAG: NAD(P)-dependent alcohol dehydrogenase [Chloroflexi bacterium]|nr:NAD(P)-dependent alcohol dehydrogenase [Chloroflexota bacterium]
MKAIVQYKYGTPDVLELKEVEKPVARDDELLVKVHAASINAADWFVLTGLPYVVRPAFGTIRPRHKIPGQDLAGTVEAVGKNVTQFKPGDEIFGENHDTFAEYVCVPEKGMALKPAVLSFEEAAAVPLAALTALQGLRDIGKVQPGHRVVINGASGGVGTFAVQIAKAFGAEVTGVCSTRNMEMVRSIGADHVIDYNKQDFTGTEKRYDVVFDLVGSPSLPACRNALVPGGILVMSAGGKGRWIGPIGRIIKAMATGPFVKNKMKPFVAGPNTTDLNELRDLIEAGKLSPVIDRRFTLKEVPEAMSLQGEGHAQGKKIIVM